MKTDKKKNIMRYIVPVTLPALCALIITGCQWTPFGTTTNDEGVGKEKLITDAVTKISSAQSMDTDIKAKMRAKAEISLVSVGINAATDLNVRSAKANNASHAKGNITFDLIGEEGSVDIETYSLDKDAMRHTYINESNALTGDSGWILIKKAEERSASISDSIIIGDGEDTYNFISPGDLLGLYSAARDSMAELTIKDGIETKEGKDCYVVEGPLKGEKVKTLTEGLGFSFPGLPGLPQPDLSEIDADIRLYFEKESREPYVIELSIPNVKANADGSSVVYGIENIDAEIKFNSFDSNNEINVPEEVVNSAVLSVDTGEIQNLLNGITQ